MNCQQAMILISGKLDGELDPRQEELLDEHLQQCADCRQEYDELLRIKEATNDMRFTDLPDRMWAGYWNGIYNRLERGIGWLLFSSGAIVLLVFGIWNILENFFMDSSIPVVVRFGVGTLITGAVILLVSIVRERLFLRKHERYDEVQR
ncbi:MAG: hypothetical protein GF307_14210 [candidate division Zixibacteria bacterium]|nr:hypothetical protein [candidate division Zixibacteria bacterium]